MGRAWAGQGREKNREKGRAGKRIETRALAGTRRETRVTKGNEEQE